MVGADLAGSVSAQAPPRRADVLLVGFGEPDFRSAVSVGATEVVSLPSGEERLVETLVDAADGTVTRGIVVGFVAGSGGAGATTLACAVAVVAALHRPAALLDVDDLGPGVEHVVGLEEVSGVGWRELSASHGRLGSRALRGSLPRRGDLAVVGWGQTPGHALDERVAREVLSAAGRGHEIVVVDLPRHLSGAAAEAASRCDHLVLVAAGTLPAAAAAARAAERLARFPAAVHLVTRTSAAAVPPHRLADALQLPLLASMAEQRRLGEHVDLGLGPTYVGRGPVARAARQVLDGLGLRAGRSR
jgi:secretion/DNA translocation related CpaE-like protein